MTTVCLTLLAVLAAWLVCKLAARSLRGDRVFSYSNGHRRVWADPIATQRRLTMACGGNYMSAARRAFPGPGAQPFVLAYVDRLLAAIRAAFDLPAIDPATGSGVDDEHAYRVFVDFLAFLKKKRKCTGTYLTSPMLTGLGTAGFPETSNSDSSSTPDASACVTQP